MYEAQAVFFYSDLSSDPMLIPHILFINLTGGKNQLRYAQRSERSHPNVLQEPRWPHSGGTMKVDWTLAPAF